jgi:predicted nucleotidyltransferase
MSKALSKFMMTLAATTVSIVLTFGTTAIIDRCKQKAEKRDMVMMVMFDMRETLKELERCDGELKDFFEVQVELVAHPEKHAESFVSLAAKFPVLDYTTTTESIFRSNIETLRTIGNILFVQTVSSFYDTREQYRANVVDEFQGLADKAIGHYEVLRDFDSPVYAFRSELYLRAMQRDFDQCKLLMKVSDKDLDKFSAQQQKLLESFQINALEETGNSTRDLSQRRKQLQEARESAQDL